ncbi:MAG: DUF2095 domain-containing protein [Candidatus Caldarchaeum sp.]|nr:DUF2095 domain-containing protein [Candidatus Caldarchaeum sp.]MDW8435045.1 DUF2095 family protein [Candidatus Caldarchaeum sp.]
MTVEEFRKKFPALYRELLERRMVLKISGVRSDGVFGEKEADYKTATVMDFLRRCDTDEQGRQVINYLFNRGEISEQTARSLLKQLEEKGIRSFGSRKEPGYYFKHGV